jgi:ribosomal protein L11 methyltransferase
MNTKTPDPPARPPTLTPPLLYAARVETSPQAADLYDEDCIAEADDQCTTWVDVDKNVAVIECFFPNRPEAEHRLTAIKGFFQNRLPDEPCNASIRELPVENWTEVWKQFFHTEKVSARIWIKPSWETCDPAPGDIILEIDPGMSFGTGQHGTTRGCLRVMDELALEPNALTLADIGCGSGILAIAASKLGYRDILAVDNDPDAVRIAGENATLNGEQNRIDFQVAALGSTPLPGRFDVVVANILADVLIAQATTLVAMVSDKPAARLVLSGILNTQAADVIAAFTSLRFVLTEHLQIGEWTTLCFKRN